MSRVRLYDEPRYYDIAFGWDISAEMGFLEEVFRRHKPDGVQSVLDLACGTGRFTLELARRGYSPAGLDLSRDMLAYVREKAAVEGLGIELFLKDMADFALYRTFDAVICMTGSISYLHPRDRVVGHLRRVAAHLVRGGLYVIDIALVSESGPPPPQEWTEERDRIKVTARWELVGAYDPESQLTTERLTLRGQERGWERVWEQEATVMLMRPQDISAIVEASGHFRLAALYRDFDISSGVAGLPEGIRVLAVLERTTAPEPVAAPSEETGDWRVPGGWGGERRSPRSREGVRRGPGGREGARRGARGGEGARPGLGGGEGARRGPGPRGADGARRGLEGGQGARRGPGMRPDAGMRPGAGVSATKPAAAAGTGVQGPGTAPDDAATPKKHRRRRGGRGRKRGPRGDGAAPGAPQAPPTE